MKDYNEVAKSVFERSKELIIKRNKRNMRIMTALRISAICLMPVCAIGFGTRWNGGQGGDIALSSSSTSQPFASNTYATNVLADPKTTADESKNPASTTVPTAAHTHDCISRPISVKKNHFETPPENGKVYISSTLQETIEFYGDSFRDGCKAPYSVILDYYKDGELVKLSKELGDSECDRLHNFIYDLYDYDNEEYPTSASLSCVVTWKNNNRDTEEAKLFGTLYKGQIENFPPNEEYAIVLDLLVFGADSDSFSDSSSEEFPDSSSQEFPASSKNFCPDHDASYISSYPKHGTDYDHAPANNTVYISEILGECMDNNSQLFDDGCCQLYQVKPVYFKDGKVFELDELLLSDESQRLLPFAYENFDPIRCLTCIIDTFYHDIDTFGNDNDNHGIELRLTKEQIESFPASEEYGISLFLAYNYYVEVDGGYNIEDPEFADGHF